MAARAGSETRLVHPFASKHYRRAVSPDTKTDDIDRSQQRGPWIVALSRLSRLGDASERPVAYAAGPGSVTTPTLSISEQGLWLNADGDGLTVTAATSAGEVLAEGKMIDSPKQTLYR